MAGQKELAELHDIAAKELVHAHRELPSSSRALTTITQS